MEKANRIKRHLIHTIHKGIVRFWIRPIETLIEPYLYTNNLLGYKRLLVDFLTWFTNLGRVIVLDLRVQVKQLLGEEWNIIYIGNGASIEAISSIFFPLPPKVVEMKRASLWQIKTLIENSIQKKDIVICELNKSIKFPQFSRYLFFTMPVWIKQKINNIERPIDHILADMNQTMRRRIRQLEKQDFSYFFSIDPNDFDRFFHTMYLPYIKSRFYGKGIVLQNYESLYQVFQRGGLLIVKQGQDEVCGMLCDIIGNTCRAWQMGVKNGDFDLVKKGSLVALWWSMLDWARLQKARQFDLGATRALISDGPFNFKRQWGTKIYPDRGVYSQWTFICRELPLKMLQFLNERGIITEVDGKNYQLYIINPTEDAENFDFSPLLNTAALNGVNGIVALNEYNFNRIIPI